MNRTELASVFLAILQLDGSPQSFLYKRDPSVAWTMGLEALISKYLDLDQSFNSFLQLARRVRFPNADNQNIQSAINDVARYVSRHDFSPRLWSRSVSKAYF